MRPRKAKRGANERALAFLETSKVFVNRMLEKCGQYRPFCRGSDRNEGYIIGYSRKSNPCYKVAKSLAELHLSPNVLWKVELMSKNRYLAEEISKQNVSSLVPPDYV